MEALLEMNNLSVSFYSHMGEVQAVRGVSFSVGRGEALGIVGESGSGKSVTLMSILRLIDSPGKIKSGEIRFDGKNMLTLSERELGHYRGGEISMIFQDPMSSLNPVYRIGNQIVETLRAHKKMTRAQAAAQAVELLRLVGIPSPEVRINNYPHEFSGGMRQRAMIAMSLACAPKLLIADEPTTALDVTIQAQILELMKDIKEKQNTAIILVTHDLGVVADLCSRIIVMYGGLIMEEGTAEDIFYRPRHPYTIGLLNSVPVPTNGGRRRLVPIEGSPIDLSNPPAGCPFVYRCKNAVGRCLESRCGMLAVGDHHWSSCWLNDPAAPDSLRKEAFEVNNHAG